MNESSLAAKAQQQQQPPDPPRPAAPAAQPPQNDLAADPTTVGLRLVAIENRLDGTKAWAEGVRAHLARLEGAVQELHGAQALVAAQLAAQQMALDQRTDRSDRSDPGPNSGAHDAPDEVMGYRPSPEQLAQLFTALAEWQAAAPGLGKTGTAAFQTNSGKDASYDYATPGDVSALARTAGAQGLSHFHREVAMPNYSVIRTYLLHKSGGFVWCDVPLLQKENRLLSPIQVWSAACTAAKRMGILSVMGILPADTDDAGNPTGGGGGGGARQGGGRPPGGGDLPKPPPLPAANIRRVGGGPAAGPRPIESAEPRPAASTSPGHAPHATTAQHSPRAYA